jgi:hypothetical protein
VATYLNVKLIRPLIIFVVAAAIVGILIVLIGEWLLATIDPYETEEIQRRELWLGVGLTFGILGVAALLSSRPDGSMGRLEKPVAIGSKPMSSEVPRGPVDLPARHGQPGEISDLVVGYTLYARNGALGYVVDILSSVEDIGGRMRTLIYARGLHGAHDEMWIPIEAVSAVYPESRTAFLAVSGDEIETFGWHRAPASFKREERTQERPLY